jgi:hypothetical protein
LNAVLTRFRNPVLAGHLVPTAVTAMLCGAIVEAGGDPAITGPAVLQRVPEMLDGVAAYWTAVHAKADADGVPADDRSNDELAGRYTEAVYAENKPAVFAYMAQRGIGLSAIAHLSRSKDLRTAVRAEGGYLEKADAADAAERTTGFLGMMLRVLDDEPLIVIDPGAKRGWRVVVSGLADNFQFHTLLADALIGPGKLPGRRPDPREVTAARDGPVDPAHPHAAGAFNLWNWTGLQPDGTLPDSLAGGDHWIWGEGTPADITPFEGTRVVLVGPSPYARGWNAGRRFDGMVGELAVERELSPAEVADWLGQMAAVAR